MKRFGLLGRTLKHSFSPKIHRMLGDYPYELFEREEEDIGELLARKDLGGLNVTIPYKETVLPWLDELTDRAERIGCVNTILFRGGRLQGHNTDYDGFLHTLDTLDLDLKGARTLILGRGATSLTVKTVCLDLGAASVVRLGREDHPILDSEIHKAEILINCTPVGMYPNNGESLVDLKDFHKMRAVIDVVYNPHRTKLLLDAGELGIPWSDGLPMLAGQAMAAAELFTGTELPRDTLDRVLKGIRRETENIVLIGMPGSGKTTLGKVLGRLTGRPLLDTDEEIQKEVNMTIPEYFEKHGEAAFRRVEKEVIRRLGKETGQIMATGGGVVTDRENYAPLKQNGRIYFVRRDLGELETEGRPLSKGGLASLEKLHAEREPLYLSFADAVFENKNLTETAAGIMEDFNEHCHH